MFYLIEMIAYEKSLFNKTHVFKNRFHAAMLTSNLISSRLGKRLESIKDLSILAIPAGGVPVGYEMARNLGLKLRLILVSKILYPWTTEAGFGAVSMHGVVKIDERAVSYFGLGRDIIKRQVEECKSKIERRKRLIKKISPEFFSYKEKNAILVDDGLASGFTMLVAIESARRFFEKVFVAVPTASLKAVELIQSKCDGVFCVNLRNLYPFAVADAYQEWYDVSDDEMLSLLRKSVDLGDAKEIPND